MILQVTHADALNLRIFVFIFLWLFCHPFFSTKKTATYQIQEEFVWK